MAPAQDDMQIHEEITTQTSQIGESKWTFRFIKQKGSQIG